MPVKKANPYVSWGVTVIVVACSILLFYDVIFSESVLMESVRALSKTLAPVMVGAVMAFLLTPVVNYIEKTLFHYNNSEHLRKGQKKGKWIRFCSILLTWSMLGLLLYGVMRMLLPSLYHSLAQLVSNAEGYYNSAEAWVLGIIRENPQYTGKVATFITNYLDESYQAGLELLSEKLLPQVQVMVHLLTGSVVGVVKILGNLLVGIIVSLYLLSGKEKFAATSCKLCYAALSPQKAQLVIRCFQAANRIFSGYVRGNLFDAMLIGMLYLIGGTIMKLPYTPIVSVVVAVTNVIPYFGPFLGAIPSGILILLDNPQKCLYFAIFILALQQFEGNIVAPKVLGDSTGLNSFWVVVAVLVGGGMCGVLGMFLGVPVFACIYSGIRAYVYYVLRRKGLPVETRRYSTHAPEKEYEEEVTLP